MAATDGGFEFLAEDSPMPTLLPTGASSWLGPEAFPVLAAGEHCTPRLAEQREASRVQSWQQPSTGSLPSGHHMGAYGDIGSSSATAAAAHLGVLVAAEARTARESAHKLSATLDAKLDQLMALQRKREAAQAAEAAAAEEQRKRQEAARAAAEAAAKEAAEKLERERQAKLAAEKAAREAAEAQKAQEAAAAAAAAAAAVGAEA